MKTFTGKDKFINNKPKFYSADSKIKKEITDSISYLKSMMNSIYKAKSLFNWQNNKPQNWIYEILNLPYTKFFKKAHNSNRSSFFIELVKI